MTDGQKAALVEHARPLALLPEFDTMVDDLREPEPNKEPASTT